MPISEVYMSAIRKFEGFTQKANWDYAQFTNGSGTRARFAGEVITTAEAEKRFNAEIQEARSIVQNFAPKLDEGTKSALTSLTFNAGTAWMKDGLGQAVTNGDLSQVREILLKYNKAGGKVLPGLVARREIEASWVGGAANHATEVSGLTSVSGAASSTEVTTADTGQRVETAEPSQTSARVTLPSRTFVGPVHPELLAKMTLDVLDLFARTDTGVMAETDRNKNDGKS